MSGLKEALVARALEEGFDMARICRPWDVPQVPARLGAFLEAGYHGQMNWLAERSHWRGDPSALWPDARSVIMLGESYTPDSDPMATLAQPEVGTISVYARNRDYHDLVKKRLKRLARWLISEAGPQGPDEAAAQVKVFVDTAPVPEKPLGQAAGLGWQGKHSNLVSRELGSWFFIGSIFTSLELDTDPAETDHCGSCRACLDICPTDAFPAPYQLDARRCISYLTIEHKGPVDPDLRALLGNHIYGCDDCLAVCPWNKFAQTARETRYHAREDLNAPPLAELAQLDDAAFRAKFSGSPIKRIGIDRFLRNVLYAIGNSGRVDLIPSAEAHVNASAPEVADAARWALLRLRTDANGQARGGEIAKSRK